MKRSLGFLAILFGRVHSVLILVVILLLAGSGPAFSQACAQDQTAADFNQGTTGTNISIVPLGDGAVSLMPLIYEQFTGSVVPTGWQSFAWSSGGTSTVSGGVVSVTGARLNSVPSSVNYNQGTSMEFIATLGAEAYQNIGFGAGTDATDDNGIYKGTNPFATFSTWNTTNTLYARVYDGSSIENVSITGLTNPIGGTFTFRIDWLADGSFQFYVDGELKHTSTYTITDAMRPAISDYTNNATALLVDRIILTPYPSPGIYESRIFDATQLIQWQEVIWNSDIPTGTSLEIYVRGGNTSTPDGTWTSFTLVPSSGTNLGMESRYIQYQAIFETTNNIFSPVLEDIAFNCSGEPTTPVITEHPASQMACENTTVVFESHATGFPPPTVHWEVSADGETWDPIDGETSSQLSFTVLTEDNGNQYRAVWTTSGTLTATSDPATLTVNVAPDGELTAANPSIVVGEDFDLVFNSTSGTGPFTLVINETEYSNITSGIQFSAGTVTEISAPVTFYPETQVVESENDIEDNSITELGLRFLSSASGVISAIRVYKVGASTPTFTVTIWERSNLTVPLAETTYTCDTTEGWKTITFPEPVAIEANTEYVASYYSSINYFYAYTLLGGFPRTSGPLSSPGVCYRDPVTPRGTWTEWSANYWLDVVFNSFVDLDLTSITGSNGCTITGDPISTASFEIQSGNLWTGGGVDEDWNTSENWYSGVVPGSSENAVIPEDATHFPSISDEITTESLIIRPSASITIIGGGALTVNGDLTTTGGTFVINSESTSSSGSLIVNGTTTGNVTYNRKMPLDKYRYLSLPVSSTTFPAGNFWRWNEPLGCWGEDPAETETTVSASGIGYTALASDNTLSFVGTVLTELLGVNATAPWYDDDQSYDNDRLANGDGVWGGGGWNLLGNPFPSALDGQMFIIGNSGSLDPNYQAMYIYDGTDYTYIAQGIPGYSDGGTFSGSDVQAGQGFFIMPRYNGVSFDFTSAMRKHNTTAVMTKSASTGDAWPGLQLKVKYGEKESSTLIVYNDQMTAGLDPGYDVGLLSSGADVEIYTLLTGVDNDFSFTRQALPTEGATGIVVPVGIDSKNGGDMTFSAYTVPLGSNKFWLEDRKTGTFTDLTTKSYSVTLPANTFGTGRFFIIASTNTPTGIDRPGTEISGLRIWNFDRKVIIQGEVSEGSLCEIFDVNGRKVTAVRLMGGEMNMVDLPSDTGGILIIKVTDGVKVITRKIANP
ncbi:MAG: Endoglucanase C precursor [Bacteroidetes bacterium ADurb.BinA104]|nr:MAG: Endoglucanase C precursor [Bacteroidetes bacterium ADurb.BinA104]